MTNRDILIYMVAGLSVWLNGAVSFRLGGHVLFENGPLVTVGVGAAIAVMVCAVFRATMGWRKAPRSQAVTVAVLMALPGLFGEVGRQALFGWATGLHAQTAPAFSAVIFFGNAALLTYAVVVSRRAPTAIV